MDLKEILNKWSPEYFTLRLYERVTEIRLPAFLLLVALYITDAVFVKPDFIPYWFQNWGSETFITLSEKLVKLLFGTLAFAGIFLTIVMDIIKSKVQATDVKFLWSNLVKYVLIYPFTIAILIELVSQLIRAGVNIPALFLLLLLFIFLTINSFYAVIKMGEHLVNIAFSKQAKLEEIKSRYPPKFLKKTVSDNGIFRLFRFEKNYGRIYIYDLNTKTRHWIKDMQTLAELGYEQDAWTDVTEDTIPEEYKKYKEGEDIFVS